MWMFYSEPLHIHVSKTRLGGPAARNEKYTCNDIARFGPLNVCDEAPFQKLMLVKQSLNLS